MGKDDISALSHGATQEIDMSSVYNKLRAVLDEAVALQRCDKNAEHCEKREQCEMELQKYHSTI